MSAPRVAWDPAQPDCRGPEGWLARTHLLPCHYFVHSFGSPATYRLAPPAPQRAQRDRRGGGGGGGAVTSGAVPVLSGHALAHMERNYGVSFPEGWVWGQAIGRGGQNVRLASELTGWTLNVMTVEEAQERSEAENKSVQENFMEALDVDEEVAVILVAEGFTTLEEVAYVPTEELLEIEEFDEGIVEELRQRARDALLTKAIASAEHPGAEPAEDLMEVEGMTQELAEKLATGGVSTRDDLAELGTDELIELVPMEEDEAGKLIMAARAHWFDEEQA